MSMTGADIIFTAFCWEASLGKHTNADQEVHGIVRIKAYTEKEHDDGTMQKQWYTITFWDDANEKVFRAMINLLPWLQPQLKAGKPFCRLIKVVGEPTINFYSDSKNGKAGLSPMIFIKPTKGIDVLDTHVPKNIPKPQGST